MNDHLEKLLLVILWSSAAIMGGMVYGFFSNNKNFKTLKNTIMATKQDFQNALDRQNTAISNIADDIRRLTAQVGGGDLTAEEEADVLGQLNARADALEALAAQTPEPPTPPAEPQA